MGGPVQHAILIDRTTGICASIYTNSLPFITKDKAWKLYEDFEAALYASL